MVVTELIEMEQDYQRGETCLLATNEQCWR